MMPGKFNELARYNTERHHGIQHTPETDVRMAALQREYYEWSNSLPLPPPRRRTIWRRIRLFLIPRERWSTQ